MSSTVSDGPKRGLKGRFWRLLGTGVFALVAWLFYKDLQTRPLPEVLLRAEALTFFVLFYWGVILIAMKVYREAWPALKDRRLPDFRSARIFWTALLAMVLFYTTSLIFPKGSLKGFASVILLVMVFAFVIGKVFVVAMAWWQRYKVSTSQHVRANRAYLKWIAFVTILLALFGTTDTLKKMGETFCAKAQIESLFKSNMCRMLGLWHPIEFLSKTPSMPPPTVPESPKPKTLPLFDSVIPTFPK